MTRQTKSISDVTKETAKKRLIVSCIEKKKKKQREEEQRVAWIEKSLQAITLCPPSLSTDRGEVGKFGKR